MSANYSHLAFPPHVYFVVALPKEEHGARSWREAAMTGDCVIVAVCSSNEDAHRWMNERKEAANAAGWQVAHWSNDVRDKSSVIPDRCVQQWLGWCAHQERVAEEDRLSEAATRSKTQMIRGVKY